MRLPRPRAHHFVLAGLVAIFMAISMLLVPVADDGRSEGGRPSTYNAGPGGLRALMFTCDALGMESGPWTGRMETLGPDVPALVAVGDPDSVPAASWLLPWVRSGGRLLLATTDPAAPDLRTFGLRRITVAMDAVRAGPDAGWTLPDAPAPVSFAFEEETLPGGSRVLARAGTAATGAPIAVAVPLDRGEVVALADASLLQNRRFREAVPALLATRLVERVADGGPVRFCETIHGHGEPPGALGVLAHLLRTTPVGHAVLGAAAFFLLHLGAGWPRFRRVRATLDPPRRSEYEYLDALAGLLHHERAWRQVGEILLQGIRRRLGGPGAGGGRQAAAALAGRIAWDRPGEEEAVEGDLGTLAAGADGAPSPGGMAAALRRLDARVRHDHRRLAGGTDPGA